MVHAAGNMTDARFLWKRVQVAHHAPWRYHLMARNLVLIFRMYYRQEPSWTLQALLNFLKTIVKILLYEKERPQKLVAIVRGVSEGFAGS